MALFKIQKGLAANLATNRPKANEGWAYFTTDDGKFYIDITGNGTQDAVVGTNRICLNAAHADTASTANKLSINSAGGPAKPVYFQDGIPKPIPNVIETSIYQTSGNFGQLAYYSSADAISPYVNTVGDISKPIYVSNGIPTLTSGWAVEYIAGTQTGATGSWTGVTKDTELETGKVIAYRLPYAGSGNATLTLTLADNTTVSGAVYAGTVRLTTHYPAGSILIMVWDGTAWRTNPYYNTNTNTLLRVYASATDLDVPLIGQSSANSTTAAWTTYTNTYKDWYGAIPNDDTKRAKINLATGVLTVPGGIIGLASQATADANGNNIIDTYLTKTAGVTNVAWDTTNKKLTKTINGSTSDVLQFAAGSNITLTAANGKLTIASSYTNTTYTLSGALASHKYTTTLTPSSGSATTSDITFVAGGAITLTDDVTNRKISIAHTDTSSQESITASGRKYITGVTLDAYGHVTGLTTGTETVTNTDYRVRQTNDASTNANYRLLLSNSANDTQEDNISRKNSNLIFNPSTGLLSTQNLSLTGELRVTGDAYLNNETYAEDITTGTLLVNGNANFIQIPTAPTAPTNDNSTKLATTEFVYNAFTTNDAMVFKGVVNSNSDLPANHKQGWVYKVGTAGTYAGQVCEINDTIYCVTDGTSANNAHWVVVQNNIDVLPIVKGGTGATTGAAAANNLLTALPTWTANPTDNTYLIRRDTNGAASYGQITFSTVWNYIKGKGDSVYKPLQTAVDSGAVTTNKWVSRLQQDANGKITATMGTLDTSGTWSGKAGSLTDLAATDLASSTDIWRRIWFAYNDNRTGRPAYSDDLAYQTSTQTLKAPNFSGNLKMEDLVPTLTKVYESTSYYATASNAAAGTWYFLNIHPDDWYKPWTIRFKVYSYCPDYPTVKSISYCTISGSMGTVSYANWNQRADAYAHYYITFYPLKVAGYDAGYGHAIGIQVYSSSSSTNSAYYRTFEVDYYDCENCTPTFLDTPVKWADWPGNTSTNYGSLANMNAVDRGLQETGDANSTTISTLYKQYGGFVAGNNIKCYQFVFQQLPPNQDKLITVYDTNNQPGKTDKVLLNAVEFDPLGLIFYYNSSGTNNIDTNVDAGRLYYSVLADLRYSFNVTSTTSATTFTGVSYNPLYLRVNIDSITGAATVDGNQPLVTTLPTTNDGKYYIYLGQIYDWYRVMLDSLGNHPVFYHNGTEIVRYYGKELGGNAQSASKVNHDLTLKINTGTTENTNLFTFNGSNDKTIDFKAGSNITLDTTTPGQIIINSSYTNTDAKVTQTITNTTNADYRLLFSATADDTTRTEGARKDTDLRWNPSTNTLNIAASNANGTIKTTSGTLSITSASTLYANAAANTSIIFQQGGVEKGRINSAGKFIFGTPANPNNLNVQTVYVEGGSFFDGQTNHEGIVTPATTNTYTLGTAGSLRWKAAYIGTADSYGSNAQPIYWNAGVPTALTHYVHVSSYTIPAAKGVCITYPSYAPVLISAQRANSQGRLILIGGGYGAGGTIRNDFTELVSSSESNFTWSLPISDSISCSIEIMNHQTSGDATILVWTKGACTFTQIDALSSPKTNRTLLTSSNYTNYTVTKTGTGASGTWGISITGNADTATSFSSGTTVALTGDTTGTSASSTKGWSVPTTTNYISFKGGRIASADIDISAMHSKMMISLASSSMTTHKPPQGDGYIMTFGWDNSYWGAQQAISHTATPHMSIRGQGGTADSWGEWIYLLDANNYTNYTVQKNGNGTKWGVAYYSDSNTITSTAQGAANNALMGNGAAAPKWTAVSPSVTWTAGTTAGPTLKITTLGVTSSAVAIPSAAAGASGIVTTEAQQFDGNKTFKGDILPQATDTYTLGSSSLSWSNIYSELFNDSIKMDKIRAWVKAGPYDAGWTRVCALTGFHGYGVGRVYINGRWSSEESTIASFEIAFSSANYAHIRQTLGATKTTPDQIRLVYSGTGGKWYLDIHIPARTASSNTGERYVTIVGILTVSEKDETSDYVADPTTTPIVTRDIIVTNDQPTITVDLASTTAGAFTGANMTTGISGTLPVSHGGTGATTAANALKNLLGTSKIGDTNKPIYWTGSAFAATSNSITIAGNNVALGGSLAADTLRTSLGLSSAMHFIGTTTTEMSDGLTTANVTVGGATHTPTAGDVVLYSDSEFVWTGSTWERLGRDSSFKTTQTAITDSTGTSESTTATRFVYSVSQDANGVISVKTRPLPTYNNYSLPLAANGTRGGIQIGYSSSGKNYAVQLSSEKAYVNVPWTDTLNTAGSTDTSSKIFLIGATTQAANPQTYSDNEVYATSGVLTAKEFAGAGTSITLGTANAAVVTDANKKLTTRGIRNNTSLGTLGWTAASTDTTLVTTNTIAYWNGYYKDTSSNLQYSKNGEIMGLSTAQTVSATKTFSAIQKFTNTTDSVHSEDTAAAVSISGGLSVAKKASVKELRIDNNESTKGVHLQYDATTETLNFVFA